MNTTINKVASFIARHQGGLGFSSLQRQLQIMIPRGENEEVVDLMLTLYSRGYGEPGVIRSKPSLDIDLLKYLESAIINERNDSPFKAGSYIKRVMDARLPIKIKAQVIMNTTLAILGQFESYESNKSADLEITPDQKFELFLELVERSFKEGYITRSGGYLQDSINVLKNPKDHFDEPLDAALIERANQTALWLEKTFSHLLTKKVSNLSSL